MSLKKSSQSDSKRYTPSSEELSYKELRFAGWYIRNKTKVANIGIAVLLIFSIITISYSTVLWIGYVAIGMDNDAQIAESSVQQFQDFTPLRSIFAPEALIIGDTEILQNGNSTDALTQVRNPNEDWIGIVHYRYGNTDAKVRVVLPENRNVLSLFGDTTEQRLRLDILSIDWQRVDAHSIPNTAAYTTPRLNIYTENTAVRTADAALGTPYTISLDLINDTAYSYWQTDAVVLMYSGNQLRAARPVRIDTFRSGDIESIQFNFVEALSGITEVEVLLDVNIFDSSVYMEVGQ
jgi:hypothetical protein